MKEAALADRCLWGLNRSDRIQRVYEPDVMGKTRHFQDTMEQSGTVLRCQAEAEMIADGAPWGR